MSELSGTVNKVLKQAIDGGLAAGLVFGSINKKGEILVAEACGKKSLAGDEPVTTDSLFAIYSCTKMVTGIAVMQLVEQGKLALDDPVDSILPEVAATQVIDDNGNLVNPKTKITLRMLLTHTAGFGYSFFSEEYVRRCEQEGLDEFSGKLEGFLRPLLFEPGTKWMYSIGIDWAGEAVQRVSGMDLETYFKKNIFEPLGITTLTFRPTPEQKANLVELHQRGEDGKLSVRGHFPYATDAPFCSGGGGLFGTLKDYLTLLVPLLNEGVGANGARILKAETVQEMYTDQLKDMPGALAQPLHSVRKDCCNDVSPVPGLKTGWGLTFQLTLDPLPTGRSAGSAWWAGISNLYWSADRERGIGTMILCQHLPFNDGGVVGTWLAAEAAVYQAVVSST